MKDKPLLKPLCHPRNPVAVTVITDSIELEWVLRAVGRGRKTSYRRFFGLLVILQP